MINLVSSDDDDDNHCGTLTEVSGNVLDAKEMYICHQCNCVTPNARGLAKQLFARYPDANVYKSRRRDRQSTHNTPGSIAVRGKIVNMFAQVQPGKPRAHETSEHRCVWFQQCLQCIQDQLGVCSIAMPCGIGCGLAGGKWNVYKQMLKEFARSSGINIVLYDYTPRSPKKRARR